MRIRRIVLSLLAGLFLMFCLQGTGWAHPPRAIDLAYQPAEGTLVVTAVHGVKDPAKHYIERVVVYVSGRKVSDESFTAQTTKKSLVTTVSVGVLPPGTEVRVEAKCSIFGTAEATLLIP